MYICMCMCISLSLSMASIYPSTKIHTHTHTHTHTNHTNLTAGFVTNVNNTRWSQQVVNAGIPGYEGYVAAGAALFIRSRTFVRRRVNFRLRPFSWIVNGVGVGGAAIAQNNLYVDKDGIRINKPQPQKNRLLQAVEDAFPGSIARVTAAGGSGLLSNLGIDRPSFIMAEVCVYCVCV